MSYLGATPLMVEFLATTNQRRKANGADDFVTILEIGVDQGQTALPLMFNLIKRDINFLWVGVDIRRDEGFLQQIYMTEGVDEVAFRHTAHVSSESTAHYIIMNSLDFLKDNSLVYDLVLIDGDHNYDTVRKELSYLNQITHPRSLVICDDYAGKHAGKDAFYGAEESHKNLEHVSKHLDVNQDKGGVTRAIDEFVEDNKEDWQMSQFFSYEPMVLARNVGMRMTPTGNTKTPNGGHIFHPDGFDIDIIL